MKLLQFLKTHRLVSGLLIFVLVLLAGGYLIGRGDEIRLYALDIQSGRVVWSILAPADIALLGSPSPGDGQIYVPMAMKGPGDQLYSQFPWKLAAFQAISGSGLWESVSDQKLLGKTSASFRPEALDKLILTTVVTEGFRGRLLALESSTGKQRWALDNLFIKIGDFTGFLNIITSGTHYGSYVIAGPTIYAVLAPADVKSSSMAPQYILTALDAETGTQRWQTPFGGKDSKLSTTTRQVFAVGNSVYVSASDKMYMFDAQNGALQSSSEADRGVMVAVNGIRYQRNSESLITAQNLQTGQVKWTFDPAGPSQLSDCANMNADARRLYVFCEAKGFNKDLSDAEAADPKNWTNFILALDAKTGREIWRQPAAYNYFMVVWQTPVLSEDSVAFVGGSSGRYQVMMLAKDTGALRWSFTIHERSDVVASDGERVYVIDRASRLQNWLTLLNPAWR